MAATTGARDASRLEALGMFFFKLFFYFTKWFFITSYVYEATMNGHHHHSTQQRRFEEEYNGWARDKQCMYLFFYIFFSTESFFVVYSWNCHHGDYMWHTMTTNGPETCCLGPMWVFIYWHMYSFFLYFKYIYKCVIIIWHFFKISWIKLSLRWLDKLG